MAHSLPEGKAWLAERYLAIDPLDVVDLGVGSGTYSDLLRPLSRGMTRWYGYEIWLPYVEAYQLRQKYSTLILGDIRETNYFLTADLIIAGDVLEHMAKPEALDVIRKAKAAAPHLFVSLPIVHYPQGAVGGNPHETHVHHWTHDEMVEALADDGGYTECFQGEVIGAYHWSKDS